MSKIHFIHRFLKGAVARAWYLFKKVDNLSGLDIELLRVYFPL